MNFNVIKYTEIRPMRFPQSAAFPATLVQTGLAGSGGLEIFLMARRRYLNTIGVSRWVGPPADVNFFGEEKLENLVLFVAALYHVAGLLYYGLHFVERYVG